MLRIIGRIFSFILLVFIVWFAVSNTEPVAFKMDLLFAALPLPGFIWGFILMGTGFLLGTVSTIAAGTERRKKTREAKRELKVAKKKVIQKDKELAKAKATSADPNDPNPVAVLTAAKTSET